MNKIGIIGGGIIGLCSAYFLQKEGYEVFVIDEKKDFQGGASYVNAGYIVPSHFISIASPDMLKKGIKWMFHPSSPFYIKPRFDIDLIRWLWLFYKSSNKLKVEKSIPILKNINLFSKELYQSIQSSQDFHFDYNKNGLLMFYQDEKVGEEEWKIGERAIQEGLDVLHLSVEEVKKIQPELDLNIRGAVHYLCDHMTPPQFMSQLKSYLKNQGVVFYNENLERFEWKGKKILKIFTENSQLQVDEVILAAGSWSSLIAKSLKVQIPLQAGKGYCVNVSSDTKITIPAILCEKKIAVTPMNSFTRFAGTMELSGINNAINRNRVDAIIEGAKKYYTHLSFSEKDKLAAQSGLRPCSPDGLPYIGKSKNYQNLTIATGHCMMGWSLGPATGKLVSEILLNQKTSLDLSPFLPDRFL